MANEQDFEDLLDPIRQALQKAYARGWKDSASRIAAMANAPPDPFARAPVTEDAAASAIPARGEKGETKRAPKGLLDPLLDAILTERPGLMTHEIERIVAEREPRIALKSIYNRLRHCEKSGIKYQRQNEKWFIRPDQAEPADPPTPRSMWLQAP